MAHDRILVIGAAGKTGGRAAACDRPARDFADVARGDGTLPA